MALVAKIFFFSLFFVKLLFSIPSLAEAVDDDERIVGGQDAEKDEYPWFAQIYTTNPNDVFEANICGGSLISPNWVLTAAHCSYFSSSDRSSDSSSDDLESLQQDVVWAWPYGLYVSPYDDDKDDGRIPRTCSDFIENPEFDYYGPQANDLALCMLNKPVKNVIPITIKKKFQESNVAATTIGFGALRSPPDDDTIETPEPRFLQKVELPLVPNDDPSCEETGEPYINNICTFDYTTKTDACVGDSGGPLFVQERGENLLVGVVSVGGGNFSACADPEEGGVYARVSQGNGYEWIKDTICGSDLPDPNFCEAVGCKDKKSTTGFLVQTLTQQPNRLTRLTCSQIKKSGHCNKMAKLNGKFKKAKVICERTCNNCKIPSGPTKPQKKPTKKSPTKCKDSGEKNKKYTILVGKKEKMLTCKKIKKKKLCKNKLKSDNKTTVKKKCKKSCNACK